MDITPTDKIAHHIRDVDGGNQLTARELGSRLASRLHGDGHFVSTADLVPFVERTNPDKRLDADRLAELIVAEFQLDKVSR